MERVLVVDDEKSVLDWMAPYLSSIGYTVYPASSAQEALDVLERHAEIDLLLTDIRMPDVDGIELAQQLKRSNPRLAVLLMSGYTDGAETAEFAVLPKPFSSTQLALTVRAILDEGAG